MALSVGGEEYGRINLRIGVMNKVTKICLTPPQAAPLSNFGEGLGCDPARGEEFSSTKMVIQMFR